jgi:PEP-CTERM motif-containing protein
VKHENEKAAICCVLALLITVQICFAQGTFQNLNFEQPNLVSSGNPDDPYLVTVASALPYWNVYYSGVQQPPMRKNGISTGATHVALLGTGNQYAPPIDGNYSVLSKGIVPGSTASISQTGLIPQERNLCTSMRNPCISFSTTAVTPEPSPLVLMGVGAVVFGLCRRLGSKSRI